MIKSFRMKKCIVFLLILCFSFGIYIVDQAYVGMMDHQSKIAIETRRVNDSSILISAFGKSISLNTKDIEGNINRFIADTTGKIENLLAESRFYTGNHSEEFVEEPTREALGLEIF